MWYIAAMELLGVQEAAKALNVSESTIRRWTDTGLLQVVRLPSGTRRLPEQSVMQMQQQMFEGLAMESLSRQEAAEAVAQEHREEVAAG